jgi:hypothetical protein
MGAGYPAPKWEISQEVSHWPELPSKDLLNLAR